MSAPYLMAVWCDRCGLPLDCPEHPHGIPVRGLDPDDVSFLGCSCPGRTCECGPEVDS